MKRTAITKWLGCLLMVGLLNAGQVFGQANSNCLGLHNPTNFSLYNSPSAGRYSGAVGTVLGSTSSCSSLGMTFSTNYSASQLATATGGSSCYNTGASDYQNHYVIKGAGTDPNTHNMLSFLPGMDTSVHSSIRIGNYCGGTQANALYYDFQVSAENALVTIYYAISLYNSLHDASYNPEFVIRVLRNNNGTYQLVGNEMCYIVQSPTNTNNLGHFTLSGSDNIFKPWAKVVINLYDLLYQQVRIEIATGDCAYSAHYGYAYVAGDCAPMRLQANGCAAGESTNVAVIDAPTGMNSYAWYRSPNGVTPSQDLNDFVAIPDATDSTLLVQAEDFILANGDTATQNTFLCRMVSYMNPDIPIVSVLTTDVSNKKPTLAIDSLLLCDGTVKLKDLSYTPYVLNENVDRVNHGLTQWKFYPSQTPVGTPIQTLTGDSVEFTYPNAGMHSVKVRISAYDTTCWNEKTVRIRSLETPQPIVTLSDQDLCPGDTIILRDATQSAVYHKWVFYSEDGDEFNDTVNHPTPALQRVFERTTRVRLFTHTNQSYHRDTNYDGIMDDIRCVAFIDTVVRVGKFPTLTVHGDTVVCNGDHSDVYVESDVANCTYDWYEYYNAGTPCQANSSHLITTINQDRRYYVKATSPNGCVSWDSVNLYLVKPDLHANKDKICTGDTVKLWAGKAASYEWTATPNDDATFWGQEGNDTIWVSPEHTTVYQVIGRGNNGCGATPLTQKITVYPYPIEAIELTPDYIDSENPSVQFSDVSENGATSLWNFGNGNTSTTRSVVWTFTDLSQDSILVSLVTGNPIGCTSDTSFWIPVGIFSVWYPNVFTPKLETNNTFKCFTANDLEDYELYIYDRAGSQVYFTTDVEGAWDGTYKGKDCKPGTYVWIAKYRRQGVERLMSQKGTVLLLK